MHLREYLDRRDESVSAFARRLQRKVTTVHGWATGRRTPDIASALAIERATEGAVRAQDFVPSRVDPTTEAA